MADLEKARGFFGEFKAFIARGNVMDMAVGVIVGGAFGKITTSLVNDIAMPAISMLTGGTNFTDWKFVLKEAVIAADGVTVEAAEVAIHYGNFLSTVLDFLIIAFTVFCMIKCINTIHNRLAKKKAEDAPEKEDAPAEPTPTKEELLLTEIRDLLKNQVEDHNACTD